MLKLIGNYDRFNNYKSNLFGTSLVIDDNIGLVNAPWNTISKRIIDIETTSLTNDRFITITSNVYDRITGLSTYLNKFKQTKLLIPSNIKPYLDLSSIEFDWIDYQYKQINTNDRIVEIHPVLDKYIDALKQSDLYNSLKVLARSKVIHIEDLPQYSIYTGFISLYTQTTSKIQRYALVTMKITPDNSTKELYIIVDYPYSETIVEFYNEISFNFTKVKFAWYFDKNDEAGSDKLISSEFNKLLEDIKSNTILIDDNDSSKIGLEF